MNQTQIMLVVAAVMVLVFLVFLLLLFSVIRIWLQALLTGTQIGIFDILGMKLRKTPPQLIVHAAIALWQRGVKVPVRDIEGYYLASAASGSPVATASELADLVEAVKRNDAASPPPPEPPAQ